MSKRLHRDERGIALVMSMMVAFVVLLLTLVVVQQAVHNLDASSADRRRLNAVNAAEAGIDWFYHHLESTAVGDLQPHLMPLTRPLGSGPAPVEFTVTPTYFTDAEGNQELVGAPSNTNYPKSVKISSIGVSAGGLTRKMESFVQLNPVYGGFEGAVISGGATNLSNNFTLNGNNGNDGDVYVLDGDFTASSGLETIRGSVYVVQGDATVSTNVRIYGNVWSYGALTLNQPQATIDGYVRSSDEWVKLTNGSVGGNAYYCGTTTGSIPATNPDKALGSKIQECTSAPPSQPFPEIKYDPAAWAAQNYTVYTAQGTGDAQCTDARNYIEGTTTGYNSGAGVPDDFTGVVVYISGTCAYSPSTNNPTITLGTNLAVVTRGSIVLNTQSTWQGQGGTRNLHFISAYPDVGTPDCTATTQDVRVENNPSFPSVEIALYSPCDVYVSNNSGPFTGQVIGNPVNVSNRFSMTYRPVLIPGSNIDGFSQDVAYLREVSV